MTFLVKMRKVGTLPRIRAERLEGGARPLLENSTVCHMSMPIPRSGVDGGLGRDPLADGFLW